MFIQHVEKTDIKTKSIYRYLMTSSVLCIPIPIHKSSRVDMMQQSLTTGICTKIKININLNIVTRLTKVYRNNH
jgi:hypothetical protein